MSTAKKYLYQLGIALLMFGFISCSTTTNSKEHQVTNNKLNPVVYFEIPVNDMARAVQFYETVFGFGFTKEIIDSNEMALFPFEADGLGISGALAKGEIYKPTKEGVLIYFRTNSIDSILTLASSAGAKILYPKTSNGDLGFVAEIEDSEGNRIGLHEAPKR